MLYHDACTAQGMTLADLLKKQETEEYYQQFGIDKVVLSQTPVCKLTVTLLSKASVVVYGSDEAVIENDTSEEVTVYIVDATGEISTNFTIAPKAFGKLWRTDGGVITINGHSTLEYEGSELALSNCPYLQILWSRVITRFNERYWTRFLSCETLEQWQVRLQVKTDEIAPRYERALRLYAANADEMDAVTGVQTTTYNSLKDAGSRSATGKESDTPDDTINDAQSYAGHTSKSTSTTDNTRTGSVTVDNRQQGGILADLNANIDGWKDIETDLIKEYASCFMSFIWM